MQDKIGLPLDEIHVNGNVPQCAFSYTRNHVGADD